VATIRTPYKSTTRTTMTTECLSGHSASSDCSQAMLRTTSPIATLHHRQKSWVSRYEAPDYLKHRSLLSRVLTRPRLSAAAIVHLALTLAHAPLTQSLRPLVEGRKVPFLPPAPPALCFPDCRTAGHQEHSLYKASILGEQEMMPRILGWLHAPPGDAHCLARWWCSQQQHSKIGHRPTIALAVRLTCSARLQRQQGCKFGSGPEVVRARDPHHRHRTVVVPQAVPRFIWDRPVLYRELVFAPGRVARKAQYGEVAARCRPRPPLRQNDDDDALHYNKAPNSRVTSRLPRRGTPMPPNTNQKSR
jgi:hypothetical protein